MLYHAAARSLRNEAELGSCSGEASEDVAGLLVVGQRLRAVALAGVGDADVVVAQRQVDLVAADAGVVVGGLLADAVGLEQDVQRLVLVAVVA